MHFDISIIIPAHQYNSYLFHCLSALEKAVRNHDAIEILIVLDGLKEDKSFFAQFNISGLTIIQQENNLGPAAARNKGAIAAKGQLLFFIDSDVTVSKDTIERAYHYLDVDDIPTAIIGSYDDQPHNQSLISKYRNLLHHYTHQTSSTQVNTFWGACGIIKREVFIAIGGFDESFQQPSIEDIELGYRLAEKGYSIKLDKSLQVKHFKNWSLSNVVYTDVFLRAKPWTILLQKHQKWDSTELNVSKREKVVAAFLSVAILAFMLSFIFPFWGILSISSLLSLTVLKRKLYYFFAQHFAVYQLPSVIAMHWLYIICAVVGFMLAHIELSLVRMKALGFRKRHLLE